MEKLRSLKLDAQCLTDHDCMMLLRILGLVRCKTDIIST